MDPAPQANYQTSGYAAMITQFKNVLFPQDTTKPYYISGAPQCPIPDSHLSDVLASAWFDYFWIQFYNTPQCSARAAIQKANGNGNNDITFKTWTAQASKNPNVKMFIGVPGSKTAAIDPSYYLTPAEIQKLVVRFWNNAKFGGLMVWEATAAQNQKPCNVDYGTWLKSILTARAAGKTFNTNTNTCAAFPPSKRSIEAAGEDADVIKRGGDYSVSYCTETATHVYAGSTSYETYEATHTIFPTMPSGYYIPSTAIIPASSSAAAVYDSSASAPTIVTNTVTSYTTICPCESAAAAGSSSAEGITTTAINTITIVPSAPSGVPAYGGSSPAAPYPIGGSGSNSTAWGTASASAAWPSGSGWVVPATGDAATQSLSVFGLVIAGVVAIVVV